MFYQFFVKTNTAYSDTAKNLELGYVCAVLCFVMIQGPMQKSDYRDILSTTKSLRPEFEKLEAGHK